MRIFFSTTALTLLCLISYSQDLTNKVKGVVKDAFTDERLMFATITLTVDTLKFYTTSDSEGRFNF
ncbi:MAG TPA: hypothetical protein PKW37_03005, partial [Salinivirgaceae bacterium]|nr:hypothetical protein [Salinivirgaceae bacterium]